MASPPARLPAGRILVAMAGPLGYPTSIPHPTMAEPPFHYQEPFPLGADDTAYELLTREHVSTGEFEGRPVLKVAPEGLALLAAEGFKAVNFMLRPAHLAQVAAILDDPLASDNDRMVALMLLRNAEIAALGILPFCQDTGTASVVAHKGQQVWTGVDDAEWLSRGIHRAYTGENLRYSQNVPLTMFEEHNTRTNLPAQIDIAAVAGDHYRFLLVAKGGGSANKTFLYQESRALLHPDRLREFCAARMRALGTAACPPYHLVFVVGGTSAEACLKTVKLASTGWLDTLPATGNEHGRAFRCRELEADLLEAARGLGIGAQFGGRHFALDVRVIRLPRHGASCPIGLGVSCSADRQAKARITRDGIFLEALERNPGRFIPERHRDWRFRGVPIDLDRGIDHVRAELSKHPVTTAVALTGTIVVARDIAHARLRERLERTGSLPAYLKDHPVYYAGPAKTPHGMPTGSFGPTTASRMDPYIEPFQRHGAALVTLGKGNRAPEVTAACRKHGGFYLGSAGGPAALLAQDHIRSQQILEFPELGMEAVWKITVENFPAFILIDDKGNDFFSRTHPCPVAR